MIVLALKSAMIFLPAGLGELFNQKGGVLNVGIEGMMLVSALVSIIVGEMTGNAWIGVSSGVVSGTLVSVLQGILAVKLKVNHLLGGMSIWLLGYGMTTWYGAPYIGPAKVTFSTYIFGFTPLYFIGLTLVPIIWFILFKTRFGLRLRVCGETPEIADRMGINVERHRFIGVLVGGALAGLSGAYLAIAFSSLWVHGLTMGRGWIALALVFFSFYRPFLMLAGSISFGFLWIAGFNLQTKLAFLGGPSFVYIIQSIPYITTMVVLSALSTEKVRKRLPGVPSAMGEPYIPPK